jgi:hypothetical protein
VVGEEMSTARLGVAAGGGGGGGGSVKIPPSAMEVVRSLKEIVENSDDEIYATLKECNMDLNETAQRLLNQGVIALTCFYSAIVFVISIFAAFSPLLVSKLYFRFQLPRAWHCGLFPLYTQHCLYSALLART